MSRTASRGRANRFAAITERRTGRRTTAARVSLSNFRGTRRLRGRSFGNRSDSIFSQGGNFRGGRGRGSGRGRGRGGARGGRGGRGGRRNEKLSADQLDQELDSYMGMDEQRAKDQLDEDIDSYMGARKTDKKAEAPGATSNTTH